MEKKYLKEIGNFLLVAGVVGGLTALSLVCDDFAKILNASQPIATFFIGVVLVIIAISNHRKTVNHKLFVSFKAKAESLSKKWGYIFDEKDNFDYTESADKEIASTYITQIYAHNEKNKVEIINKVYLQLKNREMILILDFGDKPLLIPPYVSKDSERSDPIEQEQMAYFLNPPHFYQEESQSDVEPRACIFGSSNIFYNKKNKIIMESGDERFYVTPGAPPDDQRYEKIKINKKLLVKSSSQNNKPITFSHKSFFHFGRIDQTFSENLNLLENAILTQKYATIDEKFFLCEIKEKLLEMSKKRSLPLDNDDVHQGFGFCIFRNEIDFENLYVSFFYSSRERYYFPVKQEGQDILSKFKNFNSLAYSIFQKFVIFENTDFLIFKKKPKIIE